MFKRKKREKYTATLLPVETAVLCDPEDESTMWVEFPDGLRLIFTDGNYCGFYWAGEAKNGLP